MATNPSLFAAWMTQYAQQASAATGLDVGVIIAQWGNETAWGTQFAEQNNIGNVGVYGGGPNPSYPTLEAGVQAYINEMNSPAMAKAKAQWQGQSPQQQAVILGNSGYAGGGYNNGSGPGSDLVADMAAFGGSTMTAASNMTSADWSALSAAQAAGGTQYLTALAQQSAATAATTDASQTAAASTSTNSSLASTNIGGVSYTGTQQDTSALSTIEANLQTYGFTPAQVSELTNWAWGEITNQVDPTQIAIDLQAQPAFQQQFPGFAPANAALQAKGLSAVSVQQYQQYQTQAQAMAQAAGLPAGFINSQNIGTLIGNNVSTQELSARLNDATTLALKSTPEQQAQFNAYFGTSYGDSAHGPLTTGQIAALALDPSVAEPLIAQQITTAQIGGASVTSGVGALQKSTATELAQAGITTSQATSAFQNLAPYSALETARPGMGGEAAQGVVSSDQIATGQLLGNPQAQRQLQTAEEVAKAPFSGGGGYVSTAKGAGVGSANPNGTGNT